MSQVTTSTSTSQFLRETAIPSRIKSRLRVKQIKRTLGNFETKNEDKQSSPQLSVKEAKQVDILEGIDQ